MNTARYSSETPHTAYNNNNTDNIDESESMKEKNRVITNSERVKHQKSSEYMTHGNSTRENLRHKPPNTIVAIEQTPTRTNADLTNSDNTHLILRNETGEMISQTTLDKPFQIHGTVEVCHKSDHIETPDNAVESSDIKEITDDTLVNIPM